MPPCHVIAAGEFRSGGEKRLWHSWENDVDVFGTNNSNRSNSCRMNGGMGHGGGVGVHVVDSAAVLNIF